MAIDRIVTPNRVGSFYIKGVQITIPASESPTNVDIKVDTGVLYACVGDGTGNNRVIIDKSEDQNAN